MFYGESDEYSSVYRIRRRHLQLTEKEYIILLTYIVAAVSTIAERGLRRTVARWEGAFRRVISGEGIAINACYHKALDKLVALTLSHCKR